MSLVCARERGEIERRCRMSVCVLEDAMDGRGRGIYGRRAKGGMELYVQVVDREDGKMYAGSLNY